MNRGTNHTSSSRHSLRKGQGSSRIRRADTSVTSPTRISLPSLLVLLYHFEAKPCMWNSREVPNTEPDATTVWPQEACKHFQPRQPIHARPPRATVNRTNSKLPWRGSHYTVLDDSELSLLPKLHTHTNPTTHNVAHNHPRLWRFRSR